MIHYPYLRTKKLNHGLTLTGSLLFNSDDAYDIGSATAQAKDIYSDGVIYSDKLEIGESVPTASSLAIQDNSTSGYLCHIKSSPTTASTSCILRLEADGTNWGSGSSVLILQSDDSDAYLLRAKNAADTDLAYITNGGVVYAYTALNSGSSGGINVGSTGISTYSNGNLNLIPNGSGITIVGDAGSTSHSLAANDHLLVTGSAEIDGNLFADGHFFPPTVTYSTNMNADVAGTVSEIVYCSTDSKAYVCTATGGAGSATWAALN